MRIFKNRGDIFFSKTNKEKSSEQKFLITALVVIVVFTLIFVIVTGARNDFSAKEFFKPDDLNVTEEVDTSEELVLPQISGKSNILLLVGDEDNLLFTALYQADMDNVAYKVSALKADTAVENQKLSTLFAKQGPQAVKSAAEVLFGTEIDFYISLDSDKFYELYSTFGEVDYPVISEVRYKNNDVAVPYSVRVKEGEQSLKASQFIGLIRYYLDVEGNTSLANDLLLSLASQQINEENYADRETLFSKFVTAADTDITVMDYSLSADALFVFSNSQVGVKVYNAPAVYSSGTITPDSLKEIKGYFVKE